MKILIRNSDNVVIYAQSDLLLDEEAHGKGWRDPNFNLQNATLADADLPENWQGAVWSYSNGVWAVVDAAAHTEYTAQKKATEDAAALELSKTTGIEILGVMCSATKTDQSGLSAVALGVTLARMAGQTFPDTKFEFENGNSLVVTNANFDTIYAAWMPFRQSFFTP